jgi:hypothetical protein
MSEPPLLKHEDLQMRDEAVDVRASRDLSPQRDEIDDASGPSLRDVPSTNEKRQEGARRVVFHTSPQSPSD